MVYDDSRHYTHECDAAQNSTDGRGNLYATWEAAHHTASTDRIRGERRELGMDLHTDYSDTKDGPEKNTEGMAPLSLFQTLAPTKISGDLVLLASMVLYVVNQHRILSVLDCTDFMR